MEQINKLIKDRLTIEENNNINANNIINTMSNESMNQQVSSHPQLINYYKYSEIINNSDKIQNINISDNPISNYRRQLIMAKLVISELQENISNILLEKQKIESQLNEALYSIKALHNDYISLTQKFTFVNKSINNERNNNSNDNNEKKIINLEIKIKEIEKEKNILQLKNEELEQKLNNSNELYKMQEEKYSYKILLLTKKIEKQEYEIKEQNNKILDGFNAIKYEEDKKKIKDENLSLRKENLELSNKYKDEEKKLLLDIEKFKSKINLLENQKYSLTTELKEKEILLEKEIRINEQYNTLDKHFNNSLQEKNISYNTLNDQYIKLFKEFNEYKTKVDKEKEQNDSKYNKLNIEYNKLKDSQLEYKNRLNKLTNKLKEIKGKNNNFDNNNDINFIYNNRDHNNTNEKFNNKENDIRNGKKNNANNNIENLENKLYFLTNQKEYILSLLLKVTPNKKLIKQIIELNFEILQLEKQKETIVDKITENPNLNSILHKINGQINNFKNHLLSLEEELISFDFGSSRIIENSSQSIQI